MWSRNPNSVTFDTNVLPARRQPDDLIKLAGSKGLDLARVVVTDRELEGTDIRVDIVGLNPIPASTAWAEAYWDKSVWASDESILGEILKIISNGSFPQSRDNLNDGEKRQLRDALILDAHVQQGRYILVTKDTRGFVRHGRREKFEGLYEIKIMTKEEFREFLRGLD